MHQGKKVHTTTVAPLLHLVSRQTPRSQSKETMVYTISLGDFSREQECAHTIGPERRVSHHRGLRPRKRKNDEGFHGGGVYFLSQINSYSSQMIISLTGQLHPHIGLHHPPHQDICRVCIYIYGIRPICPLHFGQNFENFPSFIVKNGPEKKRTPKCAKHAFFVVLNSSTFPTKKGKMCCFS